MANIEEKLMIETMLMNELERIKNENFKLNQEINKLKKVKETLKQEIQILKRKLWDRQKEEEHLNKEK